ncbi:MAG: hypothetical protein ACKO7D_04315 [Bacteroidota bacterium]
MNERLNFSKSAVIFMSLALILGALASNVIQEIQTNGLLFSIPYLTYLFLGISIIRIEFLSANSSEITKPSIFIQTFLSFDSLSSLIFLAFFTFCEVFFFVGIIKFSFDYLFKILNPDHQFTPLNAQFLGYFGVLIWIILVYLKLVFERSRLTWLNGLRYLVFVFAFVLISMVFYNPDHFLAFINTLMSDITVENQFSLRPQTIWELKIWQNSAGKSFMLILLVYYLVKVWKSQIRTLDSSMKLGLVTLTVVFSVIGCGIVYFTPRLVSRASDLTLLQSSKLMVVLGIISTIFFTTILLICSLSSIFLEQIKRTKYTLSFKESKYLTKKNVVFILIILIGLASGVLFIVVGFKDYFYWFGMNFLLLLILNFTIHFISSFSFNKLSKRFDDRNTENKLPTSDKFILRFILPLMLIPLLLISLPDYFTNFIGNKELTKKIEYLQDLGRITSNHHSLEPYIIRDYNKIILDIDSNKVELDKIDSLRPLQRDSIQFYLENRNYKMNESFRIEKLQFHHDAVFVKNFSKWSLLIFILSILLIYRFKLKGEE